jgi:Bacterial Ig-like domain/Carboxypeptidase regulatory-like domain
MKTSFLQTMLGVALVAGLTACPPTQTQVVVDKPQITSFSASPAVVPAGGGTVTLSWAVEKASAMTIDQGVGPVSGSSKTVEVKAATTFTLTASNGTDKATATASVTMGQDTTRPTIASSAPAHNASGVALNTGISVRFSEPMDANSVRVDASPNVLLGNATWDEAKTTVSFDPPTNLALNTQYTLTLSGDDAAGNALGGSKTISFKTVEPQTVTLSGRVIGNNGQPAAGAPVVLLSETSRTTTADNDGRFSFDQVQTPYDVAVVNGNASPTQVLVYQGLTRKDPTLLFQGTSFGQYGYTTISGALYSQGASLPATSKTICAFGSSQVTTLCGLSSNPYTAYLYWFGPSAIIGTLHVIGWQEQNGARSDYVYGKRGNLGVNSGNPTSSIDLSLDSVASGALSGSVSAPTGYALYGRSTELDFGDGATTSLQYDYSSSQSFSYVTPVIDGVTVNLSAYASGPQGESVYATRRGLGANASALKITLPSASSLSLPGNNATGVDLKTQTFSWAAAGNGGLSVVNFYGNASYALTIISNGSSFNWPRESDLGVGTAASGTGFNWSVSSLGIAGLKTVDAFAAPDVLTRYRTGDVTQGQSGVRSFTVR